MIEVFKTNVKKKREAKKVVDTLLQYFPCSKINFDLSDCDKILRVEGELFFADEIIGLVNEKGYNCAVLE